MVVQLLVSVAAPFPFRVYTSLFPCVVCTSSFYFIYLLHLFVKSFCFHKHQQYIIQEKSLVSVPLLLVLLLQLEEEAERKKLLRRDGDGSGRNTRRKSLEWW